MIFLKKCHWVIPWQLSLPALPSHFTLWVRWLGPVIWLLLNSIPQTSLTLRYSGNRRQPAKELAGKKKGRRPFVSCPYKAFIQQALSNWMLKNITESGKKTKCVLCSRNLVVFFTMFTFAVSLLYSSTGLSFRSRWTREAITLAFLVLVKILWARYTCICCEIQHLAKWAFYCERKKTRLIVKYIILTIAH